ncbi:MAG: tyrosine-protein phosphatase [Acidimicrobiales bacterium]|nr:tyrosine-protein phosphatase [Acidimicrobiales bacterium]
MKASANPRVLVRSANLRDLGGLTTPDGRTVRSGRLFRSGHLCDLDVRDRAIVTALGLRTIVDLRRPTEIANRPHPDLPDVEIIAVSVSTDDNEFAVVANAMIDPNAEPLGPGHITNYFRTLVTERIERYQTVLELATDPDRQPLLFNCTAGKDRTGMVAALLLSLLGLDRSTVMADYLLSNEVRRPWLEKAEVDLGRRIAESLGIGLSEIPNSRITAARSLLWCREEYLQAVFDAAEEHWGTWAAFMDDGLGLTNTRIDAFKTDLLN